MTNNERIIQELEKYLKDTLELLTHEKESHNLYATGAYDMCRYTLDMIKFLKGLHTKED